MSAPSPSSYGGERARRYDQESAFDKGDRARQQHAVSAALDYFGMQDVRFLDLGAGTGFFSELFLQRGQASSGVLIDASPDMLEVAARRLASHQHRLRCVAVQFQAIDWDEYRGAFDVVFSSFAVHHLEEREKKVVYIGARTSLQRDGVFILLDLFRFADPLEQGLLEYLSCSDVRERAVSYLGLDFQPPELRIDQVIMRDRMVRAAEGDKESELINIDRALTEAGFSTAVRVYQEGRIGLWICRR